MSERTDELRRNFAVCDENQDGNIQYDEFASLMSNLGADMTATECTIGFAEIDSNKDGVISLNEFVAWFTDAV